MLIKDYDQIYVLSVDKRYGKEYPRIKDMLEAKGGKVRAWLNGLGQILPESLYDQINHFPIPSTFKGNFAQYYNLYNSKKIFADAIKNGYESILFVEDDLILTDNFDEILSKASRQLPEDWNVLYYGCTLWDFPYKTISENIIKISGCYTTHAFGVKKEAFQAFVDLHEINGYDMMIREYIHPNFPCYAIQPDICLQKPGESVIWGGYQDYTKYFKHTGGIAHD